MGWSARRSRLVLACLGLGQLLAVMPAMAASWQPVGPDGGEVVQTAAARGGLLFVAAPRVLERSDDAGATWVLANAGLEGQWLEHVVADARAPRTVLVGTDTGLFRSSDGASWSRPRKGLPARGVACLAASTRTGGLAYVVLGPAPDAASKGALVLRSQDAGATWKSMGRLPSCDAGWPTAGGTALLVDPKDGAHLIAATGAGLRVSHDAGRHWRARGPAGVAFKALAMDPTHAQTLYAGALFAPAGAAHLWRSADGGETWKPIPSSSALPGGEITTIAVDPAHASTLLVGVAGNAATLLRSDDGGATFAPADGFPPPSTDDCPDAYVADIRFDASGRAWAAAAGCPARSGLFVSTDRGATWVASDRGLAATHVRELAAADDALLASTDEWGLVRWQADAGWAPVLLGAHGSAHVLAVDGATVYAGDPAGLWHSADAGASWDALTTLVLASILVDPGDPSHLLGTDSRGLLRSTDGGVTWTVVDTRLAGAQLLSSPGDAERIYAYRFVPYGVCSFVAAELWRSDDAGASWTHVKDNVKPLAVDPFDASMLYGTNAGRCFSSALLRSRDGGSTWEAVGPTDPVSALWLDPDRAGHAVVAVQSSGATPDVLETADSFATWSPLGSALPLPTVTGFVTIDQALFAATLGGGVYRLDEVP